SLGEGGAWFYTRTDGKPRDIIAMGCEGTFRHKAGGSNYGFTDSHAKYIGLNAESILSKVGNDYVMKYFAYDVSN
ncbi:MAG: hypothetical protein ABUL72_04275, partial [Armatimonadota bacterium]